MIVRLAFVHADGARKRLRGGELGILLLHIADRERAGVHDARRLGSDEARVDARRQEAAHLHVGDGVCGARFGDGGADELGPLVERERLVDAVRGLEVALKGERAALPTRAMPRGQALDAGKQRVVAGNVLETEVEGQQVFGEALLEMRMVQKRLDLRGEQKRGTALVVVERLDAEGVACEKEAAVAAVVDDEGKHAAEAVGERIAPLFVAVNEHLGVAARAEHVSGGLKLGAQFAVVVDLAVEAQNREAIGALHGLAAVGEVDDGEALEAERHLIAQEEAL